MCDDEIIFPSLVFGALERISRYLLSFVVVVGGGGGVVDAAAAAAFERRGDLYKGMFTTSYIHFFCFVHFGC